MDDEFLNNNLDLMPELGKLNILNFYLQDETKPMENKILLIYEKILEEVNTHFPIIY